MKKNKKIAVFFGGCSTEYEVSLQSASSVIKHIDTNRFTPILIGIDKKDGTWFWYQGDTEQIERDCWQTDGVCIPVFPSMDKNAHGICYLEDHALKTISLDAALPILHGKNGEDGTVQGLLEILGIPYVGCGVLASAVCMDKITANQVFTANKIGHVAWLGFDTGDYAEKKEELLSAIEKLGFPVFIKPSNAGSSVGITRCDQKEQLEPAIQEALQVDDRIVAEKGLKNFKEIEVAVLGNHHPIASRPGRILSATEVYTYESKYQNQDSRTLIPADITPQTAEEIRQTAVKAYRACGCTGLSRVDFFLTEDNRIYLNEINTLPGFTSISMFPRLFADAGIDYPELIDRLLHDAVER